ncbi:hypothetical protein [Polynucleobacter brandtiae]|uniref:Uncharacterized protein n=1 Tax=Polynucleobacter brandtiae TaxID=1938816 RepID=A0A2M8VZR1_9BURK|nr:hypothetical protein [Polynucleobacter brandtiae]PJI83338.1 hypothetical protein B0G85_0735 [Polynucleobacter brandtiae]
MIRFLFLTLAMLSSPVFADLPSDLIQACQREQVKAHSNLNKSLVEKDFQPYCACVAKAVSDKLNNRQLNELKMNGWDNKSSRFKEAQQSAEKVCMVNDAKMKA